MRRMIWIGILCAVGMGTAALTTWAADAPGEPITVTNFGKKAPVQFDHEIHGEIACEDCHHNGLDQPLCGSCHKEDDTDAPEIKDAFHKKSMGVCYDCHRDRDKETYLSCSDCHKK